MPSVLVQHDHCIPARLDSPTEYLQVKHNCFGIGMQQHQADLSVVLRTDGTKNVSGLRLLESHDLGPCPLPCPDPGSGCRPALIIPRGIISFLDQAGIVPDAGSCIDSAMKKIILVIAFD